MYKLCFFVEYFEYFNCLILTFLILNILIFEQFKLFELIELFWTDGIFLTVWIVLNCFELFSIVSDGF